MMAPDLAPVSSPVLRVGHFSRALLVYSCQAPKRMLGRRLAGYESAHSRQLFRHFLNNPAEVEITGKHVEVTLPKRAHNPLLLAAGFGQGSTPIPWWDGRPLTLKFR